MKSKIRKPSDGFLRRDGGALWGNGPGKLEYKNRLEKVIAASGINKLPESQKLTFMQKSVLAVLEYYYPNGVELDILNKTLYGWSWNTSATFRFMRILSDKGLAVQVGTFCISTQKNGEDTHKFFVFFNKVFGKEAKLSIQDSEKGVYCFEPKFEGTKEELQLVFDVIQEKLDNQLKRTR